MQSVVAEFVREHLHELSREEEDTYLRAYQQPGIADSDFSHHASMFTIDAIFDGENADVASYLSNIFSSQWRLYAQRDLSELEASFDVLRYEDAKLLTAEDFTQQNVYVSERSRRAHIFAMFGCELLWFAAVHPPNSLFTSRKDMLYHASESFQKATRVGDLVYDSLANNTDVYATLLSQKSPKYFH